MEITRYHSTSTTKPTISRSTVNSSFPQSITHRNNERESASGQSLCKYTQIAQPLTRSISQTHSMGQLHNLHMLSTLLLPSDRATDTTTAVNPPCSSWYHYDTRGYDTLTHYCTVEEGHNSSQISAVALAEVPWIRHTVMEQVLRYYKELVFFKFEMGTATIRKHDNAVNLKLYCPMFSFFFTQMWPDSTTGFRRFKLCEYRET